MISNYKIFTQNHQYKIKIKKIFKIINHEENEIYFIFIETHGQLALITLKKTFKYDDYFKFITKTDIIKILKEEEIDIEDIEFKKIVKASIPVKVEVCNNYSYFTIYRNDTKCLYTNLFIYSFNNLTTNFKDNDFSKINSDTALTEFKELIKEIYKNENNLIEEKIDDSLLKKRNSK